jgi:hypothetical protein
VGRWEVRESGGLGTSEEGRRQAGGTARGEESAAVEERRRGKCRYDAIKCGRPPPEKQAVCCRDGPRCPMPGAAAAGQPQPLCVASWNGWPVRGSVIHAAPGVPRRFS